MGGRRPDCHGLSRRVATRTRLRRRARFIVMLTGTWGRANERRWIRELAILGTGILVAVACGRFWRYMRWPDLIVACYAAGYATAVFMRYFLLERPRGVSPGRLANSCLMCLLSTLLLAWLLHVWP
jgi:hypothetical protein